MKSTVATGVFAGSNLSEAWQNTVLGIDRAPDQKLLHTVTRIDDPTTEDDHVRRAIDSLLADEGHIDVETVANTIFPARLADHCATIEELAERYRAMYTTIRRFRDNNRGTYFGRMVSYPGPTATDSTDQLTALVSRLRDQLELKGPMSTPYEVTLDSPGEDAAGTPDPRHGDSHDFDSTAVAHTNAAGEGRIRGFPCMSLLSVQIDRHHLHAFAHYRYELLIEKGYGNYLGIARLQQFLSEQVGLKVGVLTIATGRANVDVSHAKVTKHFAQDSLLVPRS